MSLRYKKGFSLIELLVSLTITGVILAFVVQNQNVYTERAALNNLADTLAITISQAQAYGISVREFGQTEDFRAGYGVSTYSQQLPSANKAYIFFADYAGGITDGIYSAGFDCPAYTGSECLEKVNLPTGFSIGDICWIRTNNTETCNLGRVDISFVRPEVEARFVIWNNGFNVIPAPNIKGVKIFLMSPSRNSRVVTVYTTGQISVQ